MPVALGTKLPSEAVQYRSLVSGVTFDRLVGRIVKEEGFDRSVAEEIMEAAICFLVICAENPDESFSPSPIVDIGWHTFILYTREYAKFCNEVAGRFIHHAPNDMPDAPQTPGGLQRTIDHIVANGLPYNALLWTGKLTGKKAEIVLGTALDVADCDNGEGPAKSCNTTNCTCT
jgi:hypothetical protein